MWKGESGEERQGRWRKLAGSGEVGRVIMVVSRRRADGKEVEVLSWGEF